MRPNDRLRMMLLVVWLPLWQSTPIHAQSETDVHFLPESVLPADAERVANEISPELEEILKGYHSLSSEVVRPPIDTRAE